VRSPGCAVPLTLWLTFPSLPQCTRRAMSRRSLQSSGPPWNRSIDFEIIAVEDCGGDGCWKIRCGVPFPFAGSLLAIARRD
jgi:hypothetical protein